MPNKLSRRDYQPPVAANVFTCWKSVSLMLPITHAYLQSVFSNVNDLFTNQTYTFARHDVLLTNPGSTSVKVISPASLNMACADSQY